MNNDRTSSPPGNKPSNRWGRGSDPRRQGSWSSPNILHSITLTSLSLFSSFFENVCSIYVFWVFGDFRKQAHLRLVQTLEDIGTGIPVVSCIWECCPHWGNHGNTSQSYRVSDQNWSLSHEGQLGPPREWPKIITVSRKSRKVSIFSSCISKKKNEHFLKQRYAKTILNKSIFAEWPLCLFVMFYPSKLSAGGAKRDNSF